MSEPTKLQIQRRGLLTTATAVISIAGLAGCISSGGGDGEDRGGDTTENEADTPTEEPEEDTETSTPQVEPSVEVVDSEVLTAPFFPDGEGSDVPWIQIDVENPTGVLHREVRVESRLRDDDNSVLDVREGFTLVLPPETTWRYYLRQDETMAVEDIEEVENTITGQETGMRGEVIENARVLDASMSFDGSAVTVTGEVDIGDTNASRITVVALIYDDEGRFRGSVSDVETDPQATDTVAFDAGLVGFRAPSSMADPDSYELLVINGSV